MTQMGPVGTASVCDLGTLGALVWSGKAKEEDQKMRDGTVNAICFLCNSTVEMGFRESHICHQ